ANLMLTMLLGGLWHGAAWKFVLWGFYQGLLLVVFRVFPSGSRNNASIPPWIRPIQVLAFFHFTCFWWLIFHCHTIIQIVTFPQAILTNLVWTSDSLHTLSVLGFLAGPVLLLDLWSEYGSAFKRMLQQVPPPLQLAFSGFRLISGSAGVVVLLFLLWFLGAR